MSVSRRSTGWAKKPGPRLSRKAGGVHRQDRLPGRVARLLQPRHRHRTSYLANVRAGHSLRDAAQSRQDRQAHRPQRVGHGATDDQCLLQPGDERDRLPGRHHAAAVLRLRDRRAPSTTAAWERHRPRVHARLRRPGQSFRRRRQHAELVELVDRRGSTTCTLRDFSGLTMSFYGLQKALAGRDQYSDSFWPGPTQLPARGAQVAVDDLHVNGPSGGSSPWADPVEEENIGDWRTGVGSRDGKLTMSYYAGSRRFQDLR